MAGKTVEIHAGASYYKFGLMQGLRSQGAKVNIPLAHALLGEQLAWYNSQAGAAPRDLPPPSRSLAPKARLATPPAPSQSSGLHVELLDVKPIPLFNYVAHIRLLPVTDGNRSFWRWESRFTTPAGREEELARIVGEDVYVAGMEAVRHLPHLQGE